MKKTAIKPKKKPCKGIGKAKGFEGCGKEFYKRQYGLCQKCYTNWLISTEEGDNQFQKLLIKSKDKVKERKDEKWKKMKTESTNWKKKLQTKVQEIARIIDSGHKCIARNRGGQMHGGHVFSKGGHTEMRFNLHNIHRQCAYSNTYKNDSDLMKAGIASEYGDLYLEFLEGQVGSEIPKLSNKEYKLRYERACKLANSFRKNESVKTAEERINIRNITNGVLDIYPVQQAVFIAFK